jgi:DNA-directed RNA polymerase subunit RPC12/RpoP
MTIRQALRRWFWFLWVGLLAVGVLSQSWRATWLNHMFREVILGFLLFCVCGIFGFGYRCPRCHAVLVHKAHVIGRGGPFACPRCGVSIDEPDDSPANAK